MITTAVGPPTRYGLPAPAHGFLQDHPTLSDALLSRLTHGDIQARPGITRFDGDRVEFTDGRHDEVDLVVWCTGYRVEMPFLDPALLGDGADGCRCTGTCSTWTPPVWRSSGSRSPPARRSPWSRRRPGWWPRDWPAPGRHRTRPGRPPPAATSCAPPPPGGAAPPAHASTSTSTWPNWAANWPPAGAARERRDERGRP
ncbi:hypothetical protein V2I01_37940 [Micromonospora sp. BRA006-A]|nr:hypothetical protein [Micromonospora sp. BRA006-A]